MIDITTITSAIITLLAALITAFLIPYIKKKLSKEDYSLLLEWTHTAVYAAEQIYRGVGRGEEKKQFVVDFLYSKGYKIDVETINTVIEAAVNTLNANLII